MGDKKLNKQWIIQNGVMTGTNTLLSSVIPLENFDNWGIELNWTGTPTGIISIEVSVSGSLHEVPDNLKNYYSLTFSPPLSQPAGSAGGYVISVNQIPFPLGKIQYVNSTGTGVLNAFLYKKDLN